MESLPYTHKDLAHILVRRKVFLAVLDSAEGRLNHAAMACPIMRYFLQRIRQVLIKWSLSKKCKKAEHYLPSQVLHDLQLWRNTVLPLIHSIMSLNLIS